MTRHDYETDFHGWASDQAALLRAGRLDVADITNIAEEIESMGRSERRELVSRLTVLLTHLLKWKFQPLGQCASWRATIKIQRLRISDHLDDNPSLRSQLPQALYRAYRAAAIGASEETMLADAVFPESSPWSLDQILDSHFWPD